MAHVLIRAAHNQLMTLFEAGVQVPIAPERDASPQREGHACKTKNVGEDVCPKGGRQNNRIQKCRRLDCGAKEKKHRNQDGKDRPSPSPPSVNFDSPFDGRGGKNEEDESGRPAKHNEYSRGRSYGARLCDWLHNTKEDMVFASG